MALKAKCMGFFFFLICFVSAKVPFPGDKTSLDFDLGLSADSPFSLHRYQDTHVAVLEVATAVLYEYGYRGEFQLYSASLGGVYNGEFFSLSSSVSLFEAFNVYREITPALQSSLRMGERNSLSLEFKPTVYSIPGHRQGAIAFSCLFKHTRNVVDIATRVDVWNLEKDQNLARGRFRFEINTDEHVLGAQAIGLSVETISHVVSLFIAEQYRLNRFLLISGAVQTKPLFLHVGLVVSQRSVEAGAIFSRHSELGWSRGGYVQYRFDADE